MTQDNSQYYPKRNKPIPEGKNCLLVCPEKILCNHCGRSSSNGIRCKGACLADSEY